MSAPLPPYSTFRTDNKVRPTAAGPAGGIGSGRRPEKGRVPRAVRPSVLRGCTEDTSVRKAVRRRPSRAFSGPPTGGTRGRSFGLNCHPFRSAVSNFQFLFSPPSSLIVFSPAPFPPALQTIAGPTSIHSQRLLAGLPTVSARLASLRTLHRWLLPRYPEWPPPIPYPLPSNKTNELILPALHAIPFFHHHVVTRMELHAQLLATVPSVLFSLPPFRLASARIGSARSPDMVVGKWIEINSFHSPPPACRCHVAIHT